MTAREVLERFPAGSPRGSWPAEEFAAERRREGTAAEVVMDLPSDSYLVVAAAGSWRCKDCDTWNGARDARRCHTCDSPRR